MDQIASALNLIERMNQMSEKYRLEVHFQDGEIHHPPEKYSELHALGYVSTIMKDGLMIKLNSAMRIISPHHIREVYIEKCQ